MLEKGQGITEMLFGFSLTHHMHNFHVTGKVNRRM